MARIATYTSRLSPEEKPPRGLTIITMGTNNPRVEGNAAGIASFAAANTALQNINQEIAVLREQLRDKLTERVEVVAAWDTEINSLAGLTYSLAGGDPVAVESAGFGIARPPSKPQPLPAPLGVRVRTNGSPGVSKVSWKKVRGAASYVLQCSEDGVEWGDSIPCTKTQHETDGAEPGKTCWFRVAAVNATGPGPWSEPARRPVM